MQRRYPKIAVYEDRIFMIDGPIWTSAGMSAGIDLRWLCWRTILAPTWLVWSPKYLDLDAESDRIQTALAYAKEHLSVPLSVQELARVAFLSQRQFSRLFK